MKNKLTINFSLLGLADLVVAVNDHAYYQGPVKNLEFDFDLKDQNILKLEFSNVQNKFEVAEVFYNHLSIEYFIYQSVFTATGSKLSWTGTEINQSGNWVYQFDQDLGKKIIKANT